MKLHNIFNAINEIDDDLILDAENIPAVTGIKYSRIFAAAAMLILAAGLCLLIHNSGAKKALRISKNNDVIISEETNSSDFRTTTVVYSTTKQNTTQNNTENITVSYEPIDAEIPSIPHETTEINSDAEIQTDIYEFPQSPVLSPENPDYDSTDGVGSDTDKENLSFVPIEEWLENTNVVWGKSNLKGAEAPVEIPSGTAEISPALQKIIEENPDPQTIFAVTVDFSSLIDEEEMNHWEYNGNTLSGIMAEISTLTENTDDIDTKEKIKQLKTELYELKSAYYSGKIESFRSTFEKNGLGIYPSRSEGAYFCTFGTSSHFLEFICGDYEAFIFYPEGSIK